MGPKMQGFYSKINCIQMKLLYFVKLMWRQGLKKCQNCKFKVNFLCQKSTQFFKKKSSKNINLGEHFLLIFFLDSIIEPLYFLILGPIFVGPTLCQFTNYCNFIWLKLIFEQKPGFWGPIKRETLWRNWH